MSKYKKQPPPDRVYPHGGNDREIRNGVVTYKYRNKEELIAAAREKGLYPPDNATPEQLREFRKRQGEHRRKTQAKYAHLQPPE